MPWAYRCGYEKAKNAPGSFGSTGPYQRDTIKGAIAVHADWTK